MVQRFEVSASWMFACGMADDAKVFDIIALHDFSNKTANPGFATMLTVNNNGKPWIVAACRGRFV